MIVNMEGLSYEERLKCPKIMEIGGRKKEQTRLDRGFQDISGRKRERRGEGRVEGREGKGGWGRKGEAEGEGEGLRHGC